MGSVFAKLFAVGMIGSCLAMAQSPGDPLTLIRVIRYGDVRDPIGPYQAVGSRSIVTGMRSITGSPQTWLVEAHGTFTSLENLDSALARLGVAADGTAYIGLYRHALSYRPDEAVKLMGQARYVQVAIYRSRPGFEIDFAEMIRMRKAALDAVNSDRPELGYQIISGSVTGTFMFLAPLSSLKTFDHSLSRWPVDAPVGPGSKAGRQIAAEGDITREHLLFRVEPRLSWVPREQ